MLRASSIIDTDDYYLNKEKLVSYLSFNRTTKLLQNKLSSESKEVIALIIDNLKGSFKDLFYGKNSNYFINDLIVKANKPQKIQIIREIQKDLYKMCFNEFASHPVQTLIEKASSKEEIDLILHSFATKKKLLALCLDSNGTFVIRKVLVCLHENFRVKINELIMSNFHSLVLDKRGVCVIVKFIQNCESIITINNLIYIFANNIIFFSTNEYSNYAVQALLSKKFPQSEFFSLLLHCIMMNFKELCTNRYGNYIVTIMLNYIDDDAKNLLYRSMKQDNADYSKYWKLIFNRLKSGF